ncbi:MAG: hypothetical protein MH204_04685, partial [Fimbriimonadaceae bacterium]|nr:hypothetical protein [Fimbriimonadaceae bacterium]
FFLGVKACSRGYGGGVCAMTLQFTWFAGAGFRHSIRVRIPAGMDRRQRWTDWARRVERMAAAGEPDLAADFRLQTARGLTAAALAGWSEEALLDVRLEGVLRLSGRFAEAPEPPEAPDWDGEARLIWDRLLGDPGEWADLFRRADEVLVPMDRS